MAARFIVDDGVDEVVCFEDIVSSSSSCLLTANTCEIDGNLQAVLKELHVMRGEQLWKDKELVQLRLDYSFAVRVLLLESEIPQEPAG